MRKKTEKKETRGFSPRLRGHVLSPTLPVSANRRASNSVIGLDLTHPIAGFGLDNGIYQAQRTI